jgi:hypothetical protein
MTGNKPKALADRITAIKSAIQPHRLRRKFRNVWDTIVYATNWRIVRAIGELQILTRASYVLLVAVPLMAATWPAVLTVVHGERVAIERANASLQNSASVAHQNLSQLRSMADVNHTVRAAVDPQLDRLEGATRRAEAAVENVLQVSARWAAEDPKLPWTLAAAFFAALAVVIGHFFYQISVPEPVKELGWDAFVDKRKENFGKHRTEEALDRANDALNTRAGRRVNAHTQRKNVDALVNFYNLLKSNVPAKDALIDIPATRVYGMREAARGADLSLDKETRDEFDAALTGYIESFAESTSKTEIAIYEMGLIERGARAEYQHLATRNSAMIIVTMLVYGVGVWLICAVVYAQARNVAMSAGIDSLRPLFIP